MACLDGDSQAGVMGHFLHIQDNLPVPHFDYCHPSTAYPMEEVFHHLVVLVALLMNSIVIYYSFLAHTEKIYYFVNSIINNCTLKPRFI